MATITRKFPHDLSEMDFEALVEFLVDGNSAQELATMLIAALPKDECQKMLDEGDRMAKELDAAEGVS